MEQSLASAMGELQGCRVRLERLRAENSSGVPLGEVERWCASITAQLSAIGDSLIVKFEAAQSKVRTRDETIRRLHRQLQEFSELSLATGRGGGSAAGGDQGASAVVAGPVGWPFSRNSTATPSALEGEDGRSTLSSTRLGLGSDAGDAESTPSVLSNARSGGLLNASPSGRQTGPNFDEDKTPGGSRPRRAAGPPSAVDPALQKVAARRGTTDAYALERAQHAQLRREVAHLRRGHVELVGQLRARDAQVEQLTAMIRELVAQRQIGLYKRQLHLQDNSLYALQEEMLLERNAPAAATGALGTAAQPASNGEQPRAARGVRPVGGSTASGASLPAGSRNDRGSRAGPRAVAEGGSAGTVSASSELRGRGSGASAINTGAPVTLRRERSVSTAPYTPRGKLRDVVGHPTRVAVETPGARSSGRTTSAARAGVAVGRSTSVEDRTARRAREGVPAARRR